MKQDWSVDFNYCRSCLTTEYKHIVLGYCQQCYKDLDQEPDLDQKYRMCLKCDKRFFSKGSRRCEPCLRKESNSSVVDRHRHRVSL